MVTGMDIRWVWDSGIAEQGVLRGYLQPSGFGVFLILSFHLIIERKYTWAIFWITPAAIMHAGYLFIGFILVFLYLAFSRFDKKAFLASIVLLLLVSPYAYYIIMEFLMIGNEAKLALEAAVRFGYEDNIHLNPYNWINPKLYVQIAIVIMAVLSTWKTRVSSFILAVTSASAVLTICAYAFNSMTLISLNPWRFSIIIIPVCSTLVLAKMVSSSMWQSARPYAFTLFGVISGAIVYFRVMGNASDSFVSTWVWFQLGIVLSCFICIRIMKTFNVQKPFRLLELLVIFGFIFTGLTELYLERTHKNNTDQFITISAIKGKTEKSTIYVVPPHWTSLRMNAQKSVFADNNLVYGPALPPLIYRLDLLEKARNTGNYQPILNSIPDSVSVKLVLDDYMYEDSGIEHSSIASNIKIYKLR
jgi:hypothetical protein